MEKVVILLKIVLQIGIIFGLFWVGQIVESLLPFNFPASVISLILLLALLVLRVIRLEQIREKADFLLANLPFFFIPSSVGIMNYITVIRDNLVAFMVICVVSTVLTFAATAYAVVLTRRLLEKRKGTAK